MLRLGFAGVAQTEDNIELITYGLISNPRNPTHKWNEHLNRSIHQVTDDLPRVLDLIRPDIIVAETVPAGRLGSNSELVVASITACKVIAFQFGIPWHDVGANTVKKQMTDDAKASKVKIRNAVFAQFPVVEERHLKIKREQKSEGEKMEGLPFDVFDAIAISVVGVKIHGDKNLSDLPEGKEDQAVLTA